MLAKLLRPKNGTRIWFGLFLLLLANASLSAQSLDPATPTPIRSNSLLGHIAARDLGDSRLTDHYYAFTGTPGDLLITVQSRNLNGDLDVFTAGSLRPLLKLTLYAESTAPVTKGIYLRSREALILRVEARSPNDDEGTYQFSFGGSFEPIIGGPDIAEIETPVAETKPTNSDGKTKRVSSVGARLPEPEPPVTEVAAAPSPTPEATATPTETESPATAREKVAAPPRSTASRTPPRARRPSGRRTPAPTTAKPKETETTVAETSTKNEETAEVSESPKPKSSSRVPTKRGATSARASKPEPTTESTSEPESGPRLIIETNDGTLINRSMSGIKRVMVENGQVVVVGKDGHIDRLLLANVVRMSIAQ